MRFPSLGYVFVFLDILRGFGRKIILCVARMELREHSRNVVLRFLSDASVNPYTSEIVERAVTLVISLKISASLEANCNLLNGS